MSPDTATPAARSHPSENDSEEPLLRGDEEIDLLRRALELGQRVELHVRGSCMRPWAFSGDRIAVERLRGDPRKGMILLTQHGEEIHAHRVIRIGRDGTVLTRGDLSASADAWIHRSAVLGRVKTIRAERGFALPVALPGLGPLGLLTAPLFRLLRRARRWARKS
jgi:hypothetical protein